MIGQPAKTASTLSLSILIFFIVSIRNFQIVTIPEYFAVKKNQIQFFAFSTQYGIVIPPVRFISFSC